MLRLLFLTVLATAAPASADVRMLDDFEDATRWQIIAADGVKATGRAVAGRDGRALRVDFDFETGGGFCVIRHELDLDLPENYRLTFDVRGEGRPNNLEFKLADPSDENVWWRHRRDYVLPSEWTTLAQKRRHFDFAWGPSGGAPLEALGAIEFAIAAGEGGKGYVVLDNLRFEPLDPPAPVTHTPKARVSSSPESTGTAIECGADGACAWRIAAGNRHPTMTLDFQQVRTYGGLLIEWDGAALPYEVQATTDGASWRTVARVERSNGGYDYVPIADGEGRGLRVVLDGAGDTRTGVRRVDLLPIEFADTPNSIARHIAADRPAGHYPRNLLDRQTYWTIVGLPDDTAEALFDTTGALEPRKARYRIEPFVRIDNKLLTWAETTRTQRLADGYLPIPSVTWQADGVELAITALVTGEPGAARLAARYTLRNTSAERIRGGLYLAARPFQVLPPWQTLNMVGGVGRIDEVRIDTNGMTIDGQAVRAAPAPDSAGAADNRQSDIVEDIARGMLPESTRAAADDGHATAAQRFGLDLAPGASQQVVLTIDLHGRGGDRVAIDADRFDALLVAESERWRALLNRVRIELPAEAQALVDTWRSNQAYILINADGPAIQPGSRTYERSWIRDGALTSTALLYTGHPEPVRRFIEWFRGYLYDDGKVPCIVDRRGPDPIPEHDSTGEYLYLLRKYHAMTGDRDLLARTLPDVIGAVQYLRNLRRERMTPQYENGPPLMQARYGLVPESISHEGYSPPRHSYWDDFFVVRGFRDARGIAAILGRDDLAEAYARDLGSMRAALYASIELAMKTHEIAYIPGCVELGDFDPTSTAIGVFPCGELERMPQAALRATFDRYLQHAGQRRAGEIEWNDYTPYELRSVGALVMMGRPAAAHELLGFFMDDRRPAGWNHWAEVVHRDPDAPKYIGDMPHTWVGSGFINSVRMLLVYQDEERDALVLAAGVPLAWIADGGVAVADLPTEYGPLSYRLERDGNTIRYRAADRVAPPGGVWLRPMFADRIRSVTIDGQPAALEAGGVRLGASDRDVRFELDE